jgi:hypothetical protein
MDEQYLFILISVLELSEIEIPLRQGFLIIPHFGGVFPSNSQNHWYKSLEDKSSRLSTRVHPMKFSSLIMLSMCQFVITYAALIPRCDTYAG